MPWIQNVGLSAATHGHHRDPGEHAMLIQITDPCYAAPVPAHHFKEIHRFQFFDVEESDPVEDEAMRCTQPQADEIVRHLQRALSEGMNVIVHCHAGICRSGAVCEVGVMMGFEDTGAYRSPNCLVKRLMMRALGWTYDS